MAYRGDGLNDIYDNDLTVKKRFITTEGTILTNPVNNSDLVSKEYCDTHGGITPFTITSFTNTVNAVEKGVTVNDATFNWTFNKVETDQTISPPLEHPVIGIRQKIYAGLGLTVDQTWTLWGEDATDSSDTATSTIYFRSKRYWEANILTSVTSAQINAMAGQELATSYTTSKSFDCSGGKYIWFCYPESWGTATFWIGGIQVTFTLSTVSHTNASGYTCNYSCYRSNNLQHGNPISVVIQ